MTGPDDVPADPTDPAEQARFAAFLAKLEPPPYPLVAPWSLSVVDLLETRFSVPGAARKVLGQLDRFGAVRLDPQEVGFDSDEVAWSKVLEVRTAPAAQVLTRHAVEREAERLKAMLPPLPGRKWVVGKVTDLLTVTIARFRDEEADALGPQIAVDIVYKGRLRKKQLEAGAVTAAVLAAVPGANDALLRTAADHGATITRS